MVERITSLRTVSAFKEKGVLSVAEFIVAGDNLVAKFPTWSWASSGEEEYETTGRSDEDDGWYVIHRNSRETKSVEVDNLPSMEIIEPNQKSSIWKILSYFGGENEKDIPDMPEFTETDAVHEPEDDNILHTRTYDVSITDDKYYQTPHLWLSGYDESKMLLQPELILKDVSWDHAGKTVTIEDHPHLPGKHASVHPSRHGAVMKKMNDIMMSRGVEPEVDKYLFLFLKFVASVIPTIEYDYTMDFDLGGSSKSKKKR